MVCSLLFFEIITRITFLCFIFFIISSPLFDKYIFNLHFSHNCIYVNHTKCTNDFFCYIVINGWFSLVSTYYNLKRNAKHMAWVPNTWLGYQTPNSQTNYWIFISNLLLPMVVKKQLCSCSRSCTVFAMLIVQYFKIKHLFVSQNFM